MRLRVDGSIKHTFPSQRYTAARKGVDSDMSGDSSSDQPNAASKVLKPSAEVAAKMQPVSRDSFHGPYFRFFPTKKPCQAPKSPNPNRIKRIHLAYLVSSNQYNQYRIKKPRSISRGFRLGSHKPFRKTILPVTALE